MRLWQRWGWWFGLCLNLFSLPAVAASQGFHYTPLRYNSDDVYDKSAYRGAEFDLLFTYLGDQVYGGSGEESLMVGIGALFQRTWQQNPFVSISPLYGCTFFLGAPDDDSGGQRGRLSIQAPLALTYFIQLYRDQRPQRAYHLGQHLAFYGSLLTPALLDVTTSSFAMAMDLGLQAGLSFSQPLPHAMLEISGAISKFLNGFYYLTDDKTNEDGWDNIEGEPVDLGIGLRYFYLPWNLSIGGQYHFTSSLADRQGDSLSLSGLQITYYPPAP